MTKFIEMRIVNIGTKILYVVQPRKEYWVRENPEHKAHFDDFLEAEKYLLDLERQYSTADWLEKEEQNRLDKLGYS